MLTSGNVEARLGVRAPLLQARVSLPQIHASEAGTRTDPPPHIASHGECAPADDPPTPGPLEAHSGEGGAGYPTGWQGSLL